MIAALKRLLTQFGLTFEKIDGKWRARWGWFTPQSPYAEIVEGTAAHATREMLKHAAPFLMLGSFATKPLPQPKVKFRRFAPRFADGELKVEPFKPIIPEAVEQRWRRELIAKALYDHWTAENELAGYDYVCWAMLLDKDTWYSRAEAVMAADPKE